MGRQIPVLRSATVAVVVIVGGWSGGTAVGQTWVGTTRSAWTNPANWNNGVVPGAGAVVVIDGDPGRRSVPFVSTGIGDIASLTVDAQDILTVNAAGLWVPAPEMTVNGQIELVAPSTGISYASMTSATLAGTGHISFNIVPTPGVQPELIAPSGGLTIPAGMTIHGTFSNGGGPLVNFGTINVDQGPTVGAAVLGNGPVATFTNRGGVISNGRKTVLNGGTNFGSLSSDRGVLELNGVVNAGTVTATGNATVILQPLPGQSDGGSPGVISANGSTVVLNYGGVPATPSSALSGISLSNSATLRFLEGQLDNTGGTLNIGSTSRLEIARDPAGGYGRGTLVGGTVVGQGPSSVLAVPNGMEADFDHVTVGGSGIIDVGRDATLYASHLTFAGATGGAIRGRKSTVVLARSDSPSVLTPLTAPGGVGLDGELTVVGDVPVNRVSPGGGGSVSVVNVVGDATNVPGARYVFALGLGGTMIEQLNVSGSLDLSAVGDRLDVSKFAFFPFGDYPIITAAEVLGTFDQVFLPEGYSLRYTPTSVVVVAPIPEPGMASVAVAMAAVGFGRRRRLVG